MLTSVLKILPSAYGLGQYFQDLGHSFSPYGPPSRQITYMYNCTLYSWAPLSCLVYELGVSCMKLG